VFQETVQDGGSSYPNTEIARELLDDAIPTSSIAGRPTIPTNGAPRVVVRKRSRTNLDVGTSVEQGACRPIVARSPVERYAQQANRGTAATSSDLVGDTQCFLGRAKRVIGLQRTKITDEIRVAAALNVDEGTDKSIVRMKATSEDDR